MPEKPTRPDIDCEPTVQDQSGYYTSNQSQLNVTRKDKFLLIMDIPNVLKPLIKKENRSCNGGNLDRLEVSIWGFVVPEMKINTMEKPYAGQTLKFSGLSRPAFPPLNVNFTIDNRFDNYFILYKWLDLQNDDVASFYDAKKLGGGNSTGKLPEYSSTFTVYALDEYNNQTAKWDYYGAFPTSIGSIQSTYRQADELESNFTFEYSQTKMSLL